MSRLATMASTVLHQTSMCGAVLGILQCALYLHHWRQSAPKMIRQCHKIPRIGKTINGRAAEAADKCVNARCVGAGHQLSGSVRAACGIGSAAGLQLRTGKL